MEASSAYGVGILGVAFVGLFVGLAFGVAFGLWYAEPRFKNGLLHEGDWHRVEDTGPKIVMWQRAEPCRKDCDDGHRAYVCTIGADTNHVDSCDCGATRVGVYGPWS